MLQKDFLKWSKHDNTKNTNGSLFERYAQCMLYGVNKQFYTAIKTG